MTGLGIRYCKQHVQAPLVLVARRRSAWWACEIDQCAYTEDVVRDSNSVIAINGQRLARPAKQSLTSRNRGRR